MTSPLVTILTPAYNRAHTLPALFRSLQQQTCFNFKWVIVDDGSTDNTRELCSRFHDTNFDITYIHKENGGKHTALNLAFKRLDTPLCFIVDSDDQLTPDAVETIQTDYPTVRDKDLCGISYLKAYEGQGTIGDPHPADHAIGNFIEVRINQNVGGDKAEVWRSDLLSELQFPVFEGEKFMGEAWVWVRMAEKRDMLMVNKVLYIAEYLEGGLSKSGRAMRIRCPYGGMAWASTTMGPRYVWRERIKGALKYLAYSFFAHTSWKERFNVRDKALTICLLPLGFALYLYWKCRYGRKK